MTVAAFWPGHLTAFDCVTGIAHVHVHCMYMGKFSCHLWNVRKISTELNFCGLELIEKNWFVYAINKVSCVQLCGWWYP